MRVKEVARAKVSPGSCVRCGAVIQIGESYKWFRFRWGSKVVFCGVHSPRLSEMTTSDKLARLYGARESVEDAISDADSIETLSSALEEAISTAEEVGSEYESSLENMPDGLQQSATGEAIQEKIDACSAWATELESCKAELESEEEISPEMLEQIQSALDALEI